MSAVSKRLVLVGFFGFIGADIRYIVQQMDIISRIPVQTLLVNILGCFLISFFVSVWSRFKKSSPLEVGLTTGLCGALTTFSTLCRQLVTLYNNDNVGEAILYIALSLVLGFAAVLAGAGIGVLGAGRRKSVI